ncbi:glutathione S-transferase [Brevundimonas sp. GN22]
MKLLIGPRQYSTWSLRPYLVLKRAGADFITLDARYDTREQKAALSKVSPSGLVPLLMIGEDEIWDSLAISEWAAETYPEAGLWPADAMARAYARAVTAEMHSGYHALRHYCGTSYEHPQVGPSVAPAPEHPDLSADIRRLVGVWTQMRQRFGSEGPWLFGRWSIADALFTPVAARVRHFQLDLGAHGDDQSIAKTYAATLLSNPDYLEWEKAASV